MGMTRWTYHKSAKAGRTSRTGFGQVDPFYDGPTDLEEKFGPIFAAALIIVFVLLVAWALLKTYVF